MKTTFIALLAANAKAQSSLDSTLLDEAARTAWADNYTNSGSSCDKNSDCYEGDSCSVFQIGGEQQSAYCNETELCTEGAEDVAESEYEYELRCNQSEDETLSLLYTVNYIWWEDNILSGWYAACTDDDDCDAE